jgi:2-polyprenyl-3-methyl-5-hydroxy-6-metoxy-1,4-benzoquinol methylase
MSTIERDSREGVQRAESSVSGKRRTARTRGRRRQGTSATKRGVGTSEADDLKVWKRVRSLEAAKAGPQRYVIGPSSTSSMVDDPKHLLFTLARYKFAAKMLGDARDLEVLEVGCSEGQGTPLLAQAAKRVVGIDFDEEAIRWAKNYETEHMSFQCRDFRKDTVGRFDAVISIDVLEHVSARYERDFKPDGFCIIGTPNVTATRYSSAFSQIGHINLFDAPRLRQLFRQYFRNVFLFGMNDEVLHTGFAPLCHYLFVLCCNKKH